MIAYLLIVLQVGLRWETGTDWAPYLEHFNLISNFASTSPLNTGMEYGYSILVWLVKLFSNEYTMLLLVHSLGFYYLIFKGMQRLSPYFFICLLLFYAFTMGVMGSHRQLMAVGILLFSVKFILERKIYLFLLCLIIASLCHTTAIICLPLYFLNRKVNAYLLFALIIIAFALGKTSIPTMMFNLIGNIGGIGDKVITYLEGGVDATKDYSVSLVGLIKRILLIVIFIASRERLAIKVQHYDFMLNSYIVGILLYFMFSSSLTILVSRGSLYFNIFETILLSCQLLLFKSDKDKILIVLALFLFSILYFIQSIAQYPDLFIPYKGLFINTDYIRDIK